MQKKQVIALICVALLFGAAYISAFAEVGKKIETTTPRITVAGSEKWLDIKVDAKEFGVDVLPNNRLFKLADGKVKAIGVESVTVTTEYENNLAETENTTKIGRLEIIGHHSSVRDAVIVSGYNMTIIFDPLEDTVTNSYDRVTGHVEIEV